MPIAWIIGILVAGAAVAAVASGAGGGGGSPRLGVQALPLKKMQAAQSTPGLPMQTPPVPGESTPGTIIIWIATMLDADNHVQWGWVYDSKGRYFEIGTPAYVQQLVDLSKIGGGGSIAYQWDMNSPDAAYRATMFQGFEWARRTGPPNGGETLLDKVTNFVVNVGAKVILGVITAINPAIGIAATLIYSAAVELAKGVPIGEVAFSTALDYARAKSGAQGASLFQQGVDAVRSGQSEGQLLELIQQKGAEYLHDSDLMKSLSSGIMLAQTQKIQQVAMASISNTLDANKRNVFETAMGLGATIRDFMIATYGPTNGEKKTVAAIAAATRSVAPTAAKKLGLG